MPIFEYLTFLCDQLDLQDNLTKYGLECWRLHTCEPITTIGPYGSGLGQILVVMDRIAEEQMEVLEETDISPEGLVMKG